MFAVLNVSVLGWANVPVFIIKYNFINVSHKKNPPF